MFWLLCRNILKQGIVKITRQLLRWRADLVLMAQIQMEVFINLSKFLLLSNGRDLANGGVTNIFYPEAIQLSEDVVFVRFYAEGMVQAGGTASDYRTRVTMNWVRENGNWVVKSQHYSGANYGGVHKTQAADFDN